MCKMQYVLALLWLYVGWVQPFSWDIVVGRDDRLEFYNNGTMVYSEIIPSAYIPSIQFDPVHNRVLILDQRMKNSSLLSFDLTNKRIESLVRNPPYYVNSIIYDPVTDLLFFITYKSIHSYSLKPGYNNKVHGNILIETDDVWMRDIAVDICGGFVYWIAKKTSIIRAQFNGAEREVVIAPNINWLYALTVDQQERKMYWIANDYNGIYSFSIECADLNGKNIRIVYATTTEQLFSMLTVSKDFIYWGGWPMKPFWQLPKNHKTHDGDVKSTLSIRYYMGIAANYRLEEQTKEIQVCDALKGLLPTNSPKVPVDVSLFCVHGTKVSGESRCECTQGYIGERCEVSMCQNYCLQGDCSVSAEGQSTCRCNAGYSGERCEVNACHEYCLNNGVCSLNEQDEPTCQCTADYTGVRCDNSICKDYCLHGDCSVGTEGQPKCRCNAGYSGERCEVAACREYCLHNGVCSLNKGDKPVCQCTADYGGERCNVPAFLIKCIHTVTMLKDMLNADISPPVTVSNM